MIWLCGALFYLYQFVIRVSPSVMDRDLMQAFGVQGCALGALSAFYYNAYSFLQVPLGTMMDYFGPRRLISVSVLACVAGCFVFATAGDVKTASLGRLLMGAGSACGFIGALTLARIWLPSHMMGFAIGITMLLGTLGAVVGQAPTAFLIEYTGWRGAILSVGAFGLVMAAVIWMVVRDRPRQALLKEGEEAPGILDGLLKVIAMPQAWLIAFYGCMMYVPLSAIVDLWGPPFIEEAYQSDRKFASGLISVITIGVAVGSPITTILSDYFKRRKPFMYVGALLSAAAYGAVIYIPGLSAYSAGALFFIGGIAFTGELLCFAAICDIVPVKYTGVALGFLNMTIMVSGVIFQPLVGALLDYSFSGEYVDGAPAFSVADFQFALMPVPIGLLFAAFLLLFVKETFPKVEEAKV